MKKLLNVLAMTSLTGAALFTVATPGTASAARVAGPSIGTLCQVIAPLNQGDCASFIATIGPNLCKYVLPSGMEVWEAFGAKNRGECISTVQQFVRDLIKSI